MKNKTKKLKNQVKILKFKTENIQNDLDCLQTKREAIKRLTMKCMRVTITTAFMLSVVIYIYDVFFKK